MKFVDEATVLVRAGSGGPGAISFLREKYLPFGGPDGGDGGRGGDVIVMADENLSTLYDIRFKREIRAGDGAPGMGKNKFGRAGEPAIIRVPPGTLVIDDDTGETLADLTEHGQTCVVAQGGRGGLGNARFKSARRQAPRIAQPGEPGEIRRIRFSLKLIADVGIVGFPSVGKSTLISVISNARPKIADYPFTTLTPNLGIVEGPNFQSYVVADIPGIIEGAHAGAGLGLRFLRHVERTRMLLHLVEITPARKSPIEDIIILNRELALFSDHLAKKEQIYVLTKCDLYGPEEQKIRDELASFLTGQPFFEISAVTGQGIKRLLQFVGEKIADHRTREKTQNPNHDPSAQETV